MFHHVKKWIVVFLTIFLYNHYNAYEIPQEIGFPNSQTHNPLKSPYYADDNLNTYGGSDREDDSREIKRQDLDFVPRSRQENGWKPILKSRDSERDSEAFKSLQLQKLRERYLQYLNSKNDPPSTTTESRLAREQSVNRDYPKVTNNMDHRVNSQVFVGGEKLGKPATTESFFYSSTKNRNLPESEDTKFIIKKPKMLNEDDIMWMHYGPPSEEDELVRYRTTRRENIEKKFTTVAPTTEANDNHDNHETPDKMTSDWLEYGLQYFLNFTRDYDKPEEKKIPKNIYEIIDKNNHDDFKPMVETTKRHAPSDSQQEQPENRKSDDFDRLIKSTENADDDSWLDVYKSVYGPGGNANEREKESAENDIKPSLEEDPRDTRQTVKISDVKFKTQSLGGFVGNYHTAQPFHDNNRKPEMHNQQTKEQKYYQENESDEIPHHSSQIKNTDDPKGEQKSGKFLGKPIIITESATPEPRLTAEYYRKLFESFGGHEENDYKTNLNAKKNLQNNIKPVEYNSTNTRNQPDMVNSLKDYDDAASNDISRVAKSYSPVNQITTRSDKNENCTSKAECKTRNIETEKSETLNGFEKPKTKDNNDESFGIFKIIGYHVKDFMPRTLKTNIFLIKKLLAECYAGYDKENANGSSFTCFKKITSRVLDKAIDSDVIKITDTVSLFKENVTKIGDDESSPRSSSTDLVEVEWLPSVLEKIHEIFSTHSLKIQLVNPQEEQNFQVEGRRRHHFRRIFPVVAGIYMTITAVMIPLVFQFMAMMGGKSFVVSKIALLIAVLSSVSKFITAGTPETSYPHHHHHHPPPPPPYPPPTYYDHPPWKKSDKRYKRRRRHYRRVFPIMVGAYMILSTVLIPLGFKFMTLLGTKSLLVSKLSLIIALMGGIKKIFGIGTDIALQSHYPSHYPTAAYPPVYPSYYDPWRRDEYRKISHYDEPTEYSHYSEEIE